MRAALRIAIVVELLVAPSIAVAGGSGRTYAINWLREQYKPRTKRCPGRTHPAFGRAGFAYPAGGPPFRLRRWAFPGP